MGKVKDLVGQKFNRLLVVERTNQRKRKNIVWKCLCDCGLANKISKIHKRDI